MNLGTGGIGPTFGEGGIDRREHRIETVAELGTVSARFPQGCGAWLT
jgi:hypothetical protein